MSRDINLVLKEDTEVLKHKKEIKKVRLAAAGSLLVVLLISLSIYLLNLRTGSSSIKEEKEALSSQLTPLREKEAKLKAVNDRLNNISLTQAKRNDVSKIVSALLDKTPSGMSVDSLEFTEGLIAVKVSSGSLILIDEFVNNLIDMAQRKEIIRTLILNSLDLSVLGEYSVSINVGLI